MAGVVRARVGAVVRRLVVACGGTVLPGGTRGRGRILGPPWPGADGGGGQGERRARGRDVGCRERTVSTGAAGDIRDRRTGCGGGVRAVVARGALLGLDRQRPFLALDGRGAAPAAGLLAALVDGLDDDAVVPGARQRGACRVGEDAPRLLVSPERIGLA